MIDDVRLCFICGAETGDCKHLEPELRQYMIRRKNFAAITTPQDEEEKSLQREYVAKVVKHRRFGPSFHAARISS